MIRSNPIGQAVTGDGRRHQVSEQHRARGSATTRDVVTPDPGTPEPSAVDECVGLRPQTGRAFHVGTIAGLPIGIAVYFWAKRVLPGSWPDRAAWEVHSTFIAWG